MCSTLTGKTFLQFNFAASPVINKWWRQWSIIVKHHKSLNLFVVPCRKRTHSTQKDTLVFVLTCFDLQTFHLNKPVSPALLPNTTVEYVRPYMRLGLCLCVWAWNLCLFDGEREGGGEGQPVFTQHSLFLRCLLFLWAFSGVCLHFS